MIFSAKSHIVPPTIALLSIKNGSPLLNTGLSRKARFLPPLTLGFPRRILSLRFIRKEGEDGDQESAGRGVDYPQRHDQFGCQRPGSGAGSASGPGRQTRVQRGGPVVRWDVPHHTRSCAAPQTPPAQAV